MAENTIKTRIQLKCDTEANWNKSVLVSEGGIEKTTGTSFIPREGEVIIYKADDTHPFSRLKVGNGTTNVVRLPFISANSINNLILVETYNDLPSTGDVNYKYIVVRTTTVYEWDQIQENYNALYNFNTTYSDGAGISISANNEINHSNSVNAQTTQAIYPIQIDAQGHISGYGSAVTIGAAAEKGVDTTISDDNPTSGNLPTTSAVVNFISTKTAGLTGAMHFKGEVNAIPSATDSITFNTYEAGDVILYNAQEYVYNKGNDANDSSWILLGDEGSYALKSNTKNVVQTINFDAGSVHTYWDAGTLPSFGEAFSIPNVTSVGSLPSLSLTTTSYYVVTSISNAFLSATISDGILSFTQGSPVEISTNAFYQVVSWNAGALPSLGSPFSIPNVSSVGTLPSLSYSYSLPTLSYSSALVVTPGNSEGGN